MALTAEVVYAVRGRADAVSVQLPEGATLADAVARSGLLERHPEIDLSRCKVGVFGRAYPASRPVRDGDRVEIYRPLAADPNEARRQRAARKRTRV